MSENKSKVTTFRTIKTFASGHACSDTLFGVLNKGFGYPLEKEEQASTSFAGGIMQQGYQCGMLWGAALAAGVEAHRQLGSDEKAEVAALSTTRELVGIFKERNNATDCMDLVNTDWNSKMDMFKYLVKGGPVKCFWGAGRFALEVPPFFRA